MTTTPKVLVATATAVVLMLSLAACSAFLPTSHSTSVHTAATSDTSKKSLTPQEQSLETLVKESRSVIPSLLAKYPGVYSSVTITAVFPSTIVYTYTYAKQENAATLKLYFDGSVPTLQKQVTTQVAPTMRSIGITGPVYATYTYLNADGSQIWSKTFADSSK